MSTADIEGEIKKLADSNGFLNVNVLHRDEEGKMCLLKTNDAGFQRYEHETTELLHSVRAINPNVYEQRIQRCRSYDCTETVNYEKALESFRTTVSLERDFLDSDDTNVKQDDLEPRHVRGEEPLAAQNNIGNVSLDDNNEDDDEKDKPEKRDVVEPRYYQVKRLFLFRTACYHIVLQSKSCCCFKCM